jgi:hypothetical protein
MLNLFTKVAGLFCTPASVKAQPDWLASVKTVADSGVSSACVPAEFVSLNPKKLSDADYAKVASDLGCEAAALKAVKTVEAAGNGFLSDGRPTILFEAHIFGKRTAYKFSKAHPKISTNKWDRSLYGAGGSNQYNRLAEAILLDRKAALESASWGLFQIMGFNYAAAGFTDVESYVRAMCQSELEHLRAFAGFVKANKTMHAALKKKDWTTFARLYNGPAFETNKYNSKLADAYRRFA